MALSGHFWTLAGFLRRLLERPVAPPSAPWTTTFEDDRGGTVRLQGRLASPREGRAVVVLVHGLGGSGDSDYLKQAAAAASSEGLASLRISLRGADGEGADFYHGGLTADLHAVVEALARQGYEAIAVLGFSLGGHIALRFATETRDPAVAAVAAVCSPLHLGPAARQIDSGAFSLYRAYILRRLKAKYASAARHGLVPTPAEVVARVRTLRQWDALTVVPRFGFRDPADYYDRASVGPRLRHLGRPALLFAAEHDPMVPSASIRPWLGRMDEKGLLTVVWSRRGGHLAFPRRAALELDGGRGYQEQVLAWLRAHLGR